MTTKPAENQPPEDAVVRVHSVEKRSTPLIVNQRRVDVPHNQDFPLAGPFVEALTNSTANFTVVRPLEQGETPAGADPEDDMTTFPAPEAPAGSGAAGSGSVDQKPGGDNMRHAPPQPAAGLVVKEGGGTVDQKPGGDNMTHAGAGATGAATTGEERALAQDEAARTAEASRTGEAAPALVITREEPPLVDPAAPAVEIKTDPEAAKEADRLRGLDRDDDGSPGGSINVEGILAMNVDEVLERAGRLDADQRAKLLAAEKKGKNRKGVTDGIAALEA